jgi:L-malate glycosyltransferase
MNILHIATIKEWRGGDSQLLNTYSLLESVPDVKQTILCPTGSVLSEKCQARQINHYTAAVNSGLSIPFVKKIRKVVRDEQIDIVHVHDSSAFSMVLLVINFFPNVKLVYSRKRNNRIANNFFKRVKYNHKRVNKIVCVSNAVRDVFDGVVKDMNKVVTIYDSIDVNFFASQKNTHRLKNEHKLPDDTILVGNIAGLTPQKDLFTFIDTADAILQKTDKNIKFVIIGEGELKSELIAYSNNKKIGEHIIFTGFRNDVHEILPELEVLLMTSVEEGLPLTIFEAFAAKTPVVTTRAGGTAEAVIHDKTGYLAEVKATDDLANGVLRIIGDDAYKEQISKNASELVVEQFNLDRMRNDYHNLYRGL